MTPLLSLHGAGATAITTRRTESRLLAFAPAAIIIACVTFNAGLAMVNANAMAMSSAIVMLTEGLLVGAAAAVVFTRWHQDMAPMLALIGLVFLFGMLRGIVTGEVQPKYIRDVMIIAIFLMLGMAATDRHLRGTVLAVQAVVFAVFMIEALLPDVYSFLFKIQDYYINTRGTSAEQFYNTNSDLFASATRPNERFFPFIAEPRMSSVFLEPVSLGNYCSIIVAFAASCYRRIGLRATIFLAVTTILMLAGCDGRLAVMTCLVILAAALVTPHLPPFSAVVYLPAAAVSIFVLAAFGIIHGGTDDLTGRLAGTVELTERFEVLDFLGMSDTFVASTVDSGLAYLIVTQSLIGLILLWMFVAWNVSEETSEQVRLTHSLCIYVTLSMLVSYSLLTIKTGALLWFIQGALQAGTVPWREHIQQQRGG